MALGRDWCRMTEGWGASDWVAVWSYPKVKFIT